MNFNFNKYLVATLLIFNLQFLTNGEANAQQIPLYSGYMVNPFLLSPSFAGNYYGEQKGRLMAMSRIQFAEIEGAPVTYLASADAKIKSQNMGLGGMVYSDSYGLLSQTGANLTYAYHAKFGSNTTLSFGLAAEIMQHGIDFDKIRAEDETENILNFESATKTLFNGSFGMHLRHKGFTLGFVAPQVYGTQMVAKDYVSNTEVNYQFERHYIGFMGYSFNTENNNWQFDPMMVMRTGHDIRPQFDVIFKTTFRNQVFASVGYRSDYAVSFGGGAILSKSLCFAYTYDLPVNDIAGFSGGSHEFGLLFAIFPSSNDLILKKAEEVKNDNLILSKEIDNLKDEIASGKENQELQKAEIERLNSVLKKYQIELDSLQNSNAKQLDKLIAIENKVDSDTKKTENENRTYYLVIASLKSQAEAYEYQQNLLRNGDTRNTFLKHSKSGTWYFVCAQKFEKANDAKAALNKELQKFNKAPYLTPWIYFDK